MRCATLLRSRFRTRERSWPRCHSARCGQQLPEEYPPKDHSLHLVAHERTWQESRHVDAVSLLARRHHSERELDVLDLTTLLHVARAKRIIEKRTLAKAEAAGRDRVVATNRRARHDFDILETVECGLVLTGSEVKSLREGKAQIAEGYARVDNGELWLFQTHIPPWLYAVGFGSHDPDRRRKLLLHRREIDELLGRTKAQPLTLIPLRLYFKEGRVKVEIAIARGRKLHDRRQELAKRDAEREMARAARNVEKYG